MEIYYEKYLKYKNKYLSLKNDSMNGGAAAGPNLYKSSFPVYNQHTASIYISLEIDKTSDIGKIIDTRCKASMGPIATALGHKNFTTVYQNLPGGFELKPHITLLEIIFDSDSGCGKEITRTFITNPNIIKTIIANNLKKSDLYGSSLHSQKGEYELFGTFFVRKYQEYNPKAFKDFKVGVYKDIMTQICKAGAMDRPIYKGMEAHVNPAKKSSNFHKFSYTAPVPGKFPAPAPVPGKAPAPALIKAPAPVPGPATVPGLIKAPVPGLIKAPAPGKFPGPAPGLIKGPGPGPAPFKGRFRVPSRGRFRVPSRGRFRVPSRGRFRVPSRGRFPVTVLAGGVVAKPLSLEYAISENFYDKGWVPHVSLIKFAPFNMPNAGDLQAIQQAFTTSAKTLPMSYVNLMGIKEKNNSGYNGSLENIKITLNHPSYAMNQHSITISL